jgi:hypothetical protein
VEAGHVNHFLILLALLADGAVCAVVGYLHGYNDGFEDGGDEAAEEYE